MENSSLEEKRFQFHGDGATLFKIFIVNYLLTVVTLGIYYPWAKAALLQYFYRETEFAGSRFQFHGTGKEMFIGMLKSFAVLAVIFGVFYLLLFTGHPALGLSILYLSIFALLPFAIVGSLKYRLSRSSWRGIHFGYRGTVKSMATEYYLGLFLTFITLGVYYAWFIVKLEKEVKNNSRFGEAEFEFTGDGGDVFVKVIIGYVLSLLTLGVYFFWMHAELLNYFNDNTFIKHNGNQSRFDSTFTGGGLFGLAIVNMLLFFFTLGIATPWIIVRTHKYLNENLSLKGDLNLDTIKQTEKSYKDATGEGFMDDLDLSIG